MFLAEALFVARDCFLFSLRNIGAVCTVPRNELCTDLGAVVGYSEAIIKFAMRPVLLGRYSNSFG